MLENALKFTFIIPVLLSAYYYRANKSQQKFITSQDEIVKSLNSSLFTYLSIIGNIDFSKLNINGKRNLKKLKTEVEIDKRLLTILTESTSTISFSKALSFFYDSPSKDHLHVFLIAQKRLTNKCKEKEWEKIYVTLTEIIEKAGNTV